jgi:hypothetical protein
MEPQLVLPRSQEPSTALLVGQMNPAHILKIYVFKVIRFHLRPNTDSSHGSRPNSMGTTHPPRAYCAYCSSNPSSFLHANSR